MTTCAERSYIDHHFECTITQAEEHAMREHLPACAACRSYYQRWLVLWRLDPDAMPATRRIGHGLGFKDAPRRIWATPVGATSVVAAAAALLLWSHGGARPDEPGFSARGALASGALSHALVYDVRQGGPPALAIGSVGRRDELAFAYENGAAKNWLMIFGVDEHRHVYWFFPAWTDPAENPGAVPIATDGARHELPEAVRHSFDGRTLEVRSLFLDTPLTVREVESLLKEHPAGPLPVPGAIESPLTFTLAP